MVRRAEREAAKLLLGPADIDVRARTGNLSVGNRSSQHFNYL